MFCGSRSKLCLEKLILKGSISPGTTQDWRKGVEARSTLYTTKPVYTLRPLTPYMMEGNALIAISRSWTSRCWGKHIFNIPENPTCVAVKFSADITCKSRHTTSRITLKQKRRQHNSTYSVRATFLSHQVGMKCHVTSGKRPRGARNVFMIEMLA